MHGDVLLFILLLVLGCAAFFFGVIYMLCKLIAGIGRGVFGVFKPRSSIEIRGRPMQASRQRACPNGQCRKVEYRDAHYCSQCGTRLM